MIIVLTLWTIGINSQGQLGDNTVVNRSSPIQVGSGTNWSLDGISHSGQAGTGSGPIVLRSLN